MPHVIYVAVGFPPAVKSSTYRLKATANLLAERGCDVTVITAHDAAWLREFGVDRRLLHGLSPRIETVKVPVDRADLDPDITRYGRWRARHPKSWLAWWRRLDQWQFPEPAFGRWRRALEDAALEVHRRKPADLVLVSCVPYTSLAVAWRLWRAHRVPYAVDYRDGWSIDVINGVPAFGRWSRRGRWEAKLMRSATRVWCVNERIGEFYRRRYRATADRVRVVRNGWDPLPDAVPAPRASDDGLVFGYVGTAVFPLDYTAAVLEAWRQARRRNELLARSSLVFRGHFGMAAGGAVNSHRRRISGYAVDNVRFEGPVSRAELAGVYRSWDALVFLITGGPYMTSGKVYEYMATGLPIMSVHAQDHGAQEVLDGYPLWVPPPDELTAEQLTDSFLRLATLAREATADQREAARAHAARFERSAAMADGIDDLLTVLDTAAHRRAPGPESLAGPEPVAAGGAG